MKKTRPFMTWMPSHSVEEETSDIPVKTEEKTSGTQVQEPKKTSDLSTTSEEKTSDPVPVPEEKTSDQETKRRRYIPVFDAKPGRQNSDAKMDALLDIYAETNVLPEGVSDRQRYSYRRHKRLLERITIAHESGKSIHPNVIKTLPEILAHYEREEYTLSNHARSVVNMLIASGRPGKRPNLTAVPGRGNKRSQGRGTSA